MRGFPFGGQTKIAYTQDPHLHALEVTDLEQSGQRTTAAFFNGTKPEYPRRMHCIQGSDAHRLTADTTAKEELGVGDRATDVLLPKSALKPCGSVPEQRLCPHPPHRHKAEPAFDFIRAARKKAPISSRISTRA